MRFVDVKMNLQHYLAQVELDCSPEDARVRMTAEGFLASFGFGVLM